MRKSRKLGLSAPYDWSDTKINDDALIFKVLEAHRFEDVVRVCIHYGVERVRYVARDIADAYIAAVLRRMLTNIELGLDLAAKRSAGDA